MSELASHPAVRLVSGCRCSPLGLTALAVGLALVTCPVGFGLDWDIERVDDSMNWIGSSISIAVDDHGVPHIGQGAHRSQIMRYAVKPEDVWLIEEVDVYPSGLCASATVAPNGDPCLAYLRWDSLIFARLSGGTWTLETIDTMHADTRCELRFSAAGVPHIAYCKQGDPWSLKHAWKPAGTWLVETADPTVAAGNDIAMALDDLGNPHIGHWAAPNYGAGPFETRYTWWDGLTWQHELVDDSGENCNVIKSGLALDSNGNPHLLYFTHRCGGATALRYAVRDGGWVITTIDANCDSSAGCALVLDRTGAPHVIYGEGYVMSGGSSQLRYAHLDDQGSWVIEVVDADGDAGEFNSLALDRRGYLHAAYFRGPGSGQDGEVRYARSTTPVAPGLGDLNCDGVLDAFDIDPFVLALTDPVGYAAQYPDCDRMLADIDGDGDVDAFDIDPFVELLVGP